MNIDNLPNADPDDETSPGGLLLVLLFVIGIPRLAVVGKLPGIWD